MSIKKIQAQTQYDIVKVVGTDERFEKYGSDVFLMPQRKAAII